MQAILDKLAYINDKIRYKPEPPEMKLYPKLHWRLMASMIDVFIAVVLLIPIMPHKTPDPVVLELQQRLESQTIEPKEAAEIFWNYLINQNGLSMAASEFVVQYIVAGIVVLLFWFYRYATPGKMLLRMEIVDQKTFGKPTRKQLFIRYLAYLPSMIPFGAGLFWVLISPRRQALHDKIAGTVVVFKHRKPMA